MSQLSLIEILLPTDNNDTICKAMGLSSNLMILKIYNNQSKDDDENMPTVSKGLVNIGALLDEQHYTQPPPRYSEASFSKKTRGTRRPSTYASIISTIANRGYAEILNKRFNR